MERVVVLWVKLVVLALCLGCIYCCGCDDVDCDDPDNLPQGYDEQSVDLETLEVKIVPFEMTDPLGGDLEYVIDGDAVPFQAEIVDYWAPDADSDAEAVKAIKITAPEFPLMPESDYETLGSLVVNVSNECGNPDLQFYIHMMYGCDPIPLQVDEDGSGMRHVKIIGSRYKQDTGVTIESGQKIHIFADGEICWSKWEESTCRGVAQDIGNTWGVWAKINDDYYPLQEIITIENSESSGELSFIVPDGSRPEEFITAGDEQYCEYDVYKDSGGPGIDISFFVE